MDRKSHFTDLYPGDMTMWMFENHPRYDYHLLQFVRRYEEGCKLAKEAMCLKQKQEEKELVLT